MGLEILMIDIKRLHELEKEVQDTHDQIIRQVWLVHHIIGKDTKSDRDVLIDIDRVYELVDKKTNIPYVVIISHDFVYGPGDVYKVYESTVYIKKELFDMTEEELRANKERLIKELKETNQSEEHPVSFVD